MTLIEFLLARITEDEQLARESICPCGGPVCTVEHGWYREDELRERLRDFGQPTRQIPHILRWAPARVLTECEAKRRIVESGGSECGGYAQGGEGDHYPGPQSYPCDGCSAAEASDARHAWTLRVQAQPYADHPDYDPEWTP